jgi:NADH-quinone oxidoreductase subunit L
LHASPDAALVVAIVGAATAFVAATIACAQQDIKKVLAYSTVSQLGYMFLAIGCGAYEAAIFLMVAHAFFKALLFLGSGSVIHGLDDEQDLKRMGNLRRYLPITFITFAVGWLAIAAVPPLSGFWAKGDILENAFVARPALWAVGLVTAALTAYYMSRLTGLAFFGADRWATGEDPPGRVSAMSGIPHAEHRVEHPHESPWVMTVPLWILAFFAAVAGSMAISDWPLSLARFVDPVFGANLFNDHLATSSIWILAVVDSLIALAGVGVGLRLWMTRSEHPALETAFLRFAWYINELYDAIFGRPSERLATFCAEVVEPKVIDGAVNGTADLVRGAGATLRRTQTGYVRNYVLGIALGTVLVLAFMLTRLWWS